MPAIKTDDLSASLRSRSIRPETRELLISRIGGSAQEADLSHARIIGAGRRVARQLFNLLLIELQEHTIRKEA